MSFRIDPRLPLTGEVRRILAAEIGKALGHLEKARDMPEQGLHKCRKRLKSIRALLRLVRSGDESFWQTENECYRQVSALLAGPREATALIETLDRLSDAFPKQSAGGGLDSVRERLVLRQHELHAGPGLDAAINAAIAACQEGLERTDGLSLPDQPERAADILAEGARATLRRARKALDKAGSRGGADDFHELRTAAKTHSMHLSLLGRLWPTPIKARRKAVDKLGELLGELHDVFVMRALLEADGEPLGPPGETRLLRKLLKRSQKSLTRACLAEAAELFDDSPRRSARKLARKARGDLTAPPAETSAATA
ncbi:MULTISPECIES: CHAD domain-containing protein [unclassified Mesorhizobium]|uniref:CHAD domain-containing protein n=1 Tax=unclassified Mesorhizobium TaxID=325217 RepID=UPI000BB07D1D|nr:MULTISPECIES: CHAD domain-containing protein [unclassified Mesorhizobium]TGT60450.1 CHAD domain-containing protein [Mesorhizobium sp. M00.F.Ca.ET.170.01.1.1]AZO10446.1 CHAD domain-containing protein [Mesorhizobium sp. M3A.F.Ca.ET.080.04.2.1]PBB87967.1 metal-binding protein [Mesorhizobium sp. WSM3876]RWB69104.1 MAG: CHAD domain-containing protein [Mesorhizobium sp.]RWB91885.1 MAG: CHAD domain-containing protein [Mesorhizobium sp.]